MSGATVAVPTKRQAMKLAREVLTDLATQAHDIDRVAGLGVIAFHLPERWRFVDFPDHERGCECEECRAAWRIVCAACSAEASMKQAKASTMSGSLTNDCVIACSMGRSDRAERRRRAGATIERAHVQEDRVNRRTFFQAIAGAAVAGPIVSEAANRAADDSCIVRIIVRNEATPVRNEATPALERAEALRMRLDVEVQAITSAQSGYAVHGAALAALRTVEEIVDVGYGIDGQTGKAYSGWAIERVTQIEALADDRYDEFIRAMKGGL